MGRASSLLAIALVLLALVPAGSAADSTAAGKAQLQLLDRAPVKVRGTGFAAGERVSVSVTGLGGTTRKSVVAGTRGGWTATFLNRAFTRCRGLVVSAVGNRGSRAGLRLPPALCAPPAPAP